MKAGRPFIENEESRQRRRQVYLSDHWVEFARELGDGNVSEGLRMALYIAWTQCAERRVENDISN